ncbi:MAG: sulfatase-like hydrolase/transferase [Schlesneria sp.]
MPQISAKPQPTMKASEKERTLHLFTLCAFAVTQPLLEALSHQTVYLHDQQFGWIEIGLLLVVLMIVVPLGFVGADKVFRRLSIMFYGRGHNTVMIVLMSLLILSLIRPYIPDNRLTLIGLTGVIAPATALGCSCLLASAYERRQWLRSWLTLTSIGIVLSPALFLMNYERSRLKETPVEATVPVKNPVPIVFIIFDELSANTLVNEQLEIDSRRFPQFARLASISTWYRNATTVSPRTEFAVPAILSGRFPAREAPAMAADYPGNLFQLIEATKSFEMVVFEPVTRLCPLSVLQTRTPEQSLKKKCWNLFAALVTVYPRLIFSSDTPVWFPEMPRQWFGIPPEEVLLAKLDETKTGLIRYSSTEERDHQQKHFLKFLCPSEIPRFCFFHTVLPHYPWTYLASGEQYQSEFGAPPSPAGAHGELGENWDNDPPTVIRNEFRYRQQVGYVDRFIGQVLDRLKETDLLDRCLLIVTADHGVSFHPGHSRRLPDADNLSDIMNVPMFVKLPGQLIGTTDDRNIESVDLLPTIAEVIGVPLPEPIDGTSVSDDVRRPRKTLYYHGSMTVCEPDVPGRLNSIRRQQILYGNQGLDWMPSVATSHPDWHGRSIKGFIIDEQTVPVEFIEAQDQNNRNAYSSDLEIVPRFISGILDADDLSTVPAEMILVIDGIIRDTSKTSLIMYKKQRFEFLITESMAPGSVGKVELFVVDSKQSNVRLRRLRVKDQLPEN